MRPIVMRRTLAGTLNYLLHQSANVPLAQTIRPAEEDVDLVAFVFAHRVTLLHALRVYESINRVTT